MTESFAESCERKAFADRVRVFERTKASVAAYRRILAEHGLKDFVPSSAEDWQRLPWIDKENYINRFPPEDRSPEGRIPIAAHASSGSSGKATFWFRGPKHKRIGTAYYSRIIDDVMRIPRSRRTLVIICFAMGIWVAGSYTLLAFEAIGEQEGRNLTVVSPGMEIDDLISIFGRLGPVFDQIVIAGYPAALDVLFDQLGHRMISVPGKLYLVTSGDKISEEWRNTKMGALGIASPESIVNVYGSADGGLLAIETPLSIEIRRKLLASPGLAAQILSEPAGSVPALFQFDPALVCFEEADGELAFTADLDTPLVRYNLHDRGKVIPFEKMMGLAGELRIQNADAWEWPFLVVSGRSDIAVFLYGAKIYPEHVQRAMQDTRIRDWLTGSFFACSVQKESRQLFCLDCELSGNGVKEESLISITIASVIQERLIEVCSEYRNSCQKLGTVMNQPHVRLYRKGDERFAELSRPPEYSRAGGGSAVSGFLWQVGRKPKVVVVSQPAE